MTPATTLNIGRQLADIGRVLDWLGTQLAVDDLPDGLLGRVMLATEEVAVNAIMHGGAEDAGPIIIGVCQDGASVTVTLRYAGPRFDPGAPHHRLDSPDERIGGHGLHLVQEATDRITHRYEAGENAVALGFCKKRH